MFRTSPYPPPQSSLGLLTTLENNLSDKKPSPPGERLLKPWAILKRLRPVKLETLRKELQRHHRLNLGLKLIETHFPQLLYQYGPVSDIGWQEVLADMVNLVAAAGWFEINWEGALNPAYAYWQEDSGENGDRLAVFLEYIPVTLYGFTDGENIFEFPPIELLHGLLAKCEIRTVSASLLSDAELYDELDDIWNDSDREMAWAMLSQIEADPGQYPEPVKWLPELARWACHSTGNFMLDRHFAPHRDGPWLTWADHLEEVKHAWRRAQPVIQAFHRLMAWYEADHGKLADLAKFIMNGGNCDNLDW